MKMYRPGVTPFQYQVNTVERRENIDGSEYTVIEFYPWQIPENIRVLAWCMDNICFP